MNLNFDKVTIEVSVSDLHKIETLIDLAIERSIQDGGRFEPHLNEEISNLMGLYHRIIPDVMKQTF